MENYYIKRTTQSHFYPQAKHRQQSSLNQTLDERGKTTSHAVCGEQLYHDVLSQEVATQPELPNQHETSAAQVWLIQEPIIE